MSEATPTPTDTADPETPQPQPDPQPVPEPPGAAPTPPPGVTPPPQDQAPPPPQPDPPPAKEDPAPARASQLVKYTEEDKRIIRAQLGDDLTDAEIDFAMAQGERLGLDVISKQLQVWKQQGKLITMVSIDGLRLVARRTGEYLGMRGPVFLTEDGQWVDVWLPKYGDHPLAARCWVLRQGDAEWTIGVAGWSEFAKYHFNKQGEWVPQSNWNPQGGMPSHMLGKVCEAIALRRAFPAELSGVYTDDELQQAKDLLSAQAPDPANRPGRGTATAQRVHEMMARLPVEVLEQLELWWQSKYVPAVVRRPYADVGRLQDGAVELFTEDSPHMTKVLELVTKALAKVQAPAPPDPTGPPPEASGTGVSSSAAADTGEAPAVPDQEFLILDALEGQPMRQMDLAKLLGVDPKDQGLRTSLAVLQDQDLVEKQGRGPVAQWNITDLGAQVLVQADNQTGEPSD